MIKSIGLMALMSLALSACDTGPYNPSARHQADSSTGSMLSGADTGVNNNGSLSDTSIGSNKGFGAPGHGGN